jgi:hypothetical protein
LHTLLAEDCQENPVNTVRRFPIVSPYYKVYIFIT